MGIVEAISTNSRTKVSFKLGFYEIFQESFKCLPFVFKKISMNFAVFWFPIVATIIALLPYGSDSIGLYIRQTILIGLLLMEHCFMIFIAPYYVFVFINQNASRSTPNFWDFLSENMFPLVINHIKTTMTILLHLLLLIIPGIIKTLQLSLVTQSTFFDERCKNGKISALKISQETTKGFLCGISLLIVITSILPFVLKPIYTKLMAGYSEQITLVNLIEMSQFITTFYLNCFGLILMTQAYFVLKRYKK